MKNIVIIDASPRKGGNTDVLTDAAAAAIEAAGASVTRCHIRDAKINPCLGCNACVVYCPKKAVQYKTPEAYAKLDNIITRRMGLPEKRTRYHNPHVTARDIISDAEQIVSE